MNAFNTPEIYQAALVRRFGKVPSLTDLARMENAAMRSKSDPPAPAVTESVTAARIARALPGADTKAKIFKLVKAGYGKPKEIAEALGMSCDHVRVILRAFRDEGAMVSTGTTRSVFYEVAK